MNEDLKRPSPILMREEVLKRKNQPRVGEVNLDIRSPTIVVQWSEILDKYENFKKKNTQQLKIMIRQGIPNSLRGRGWMKFAGLDTHVTCDEMESLIKKHLESEPSNSTHYGGAIDRDVCRTFPDYAMFKDNNYGFWELKRVLIAYATKHPEVYFFLILDWLLSRYEFCCWCIITIFK